MKKSLQPPERIGAVLESFLAERGYLNACREIEIQHQWPQIVGERIAAVAQCMRIEEGVVHVRVDSAPWRQELAYLKTTLVAEMRKRCPTIKDIVFY